MSSFLKVRTALLTLAMFGSAAAAEAEPIRGLGTLLGDHDIITVNLRSRARDFSLFGSAAPIFGFWGPACVGDCLPGEQRSLDAAFTGGDFVGRLSIDGGDYRFGFFSDQLGEARVRSSREPGPHPSSPVEPAPRLFAPSPSRAISDIPCLMTEGNLRRWKAVGRARAQRSEPQERSEPSERRASDGVRGPGTKSRDLLVRKNVRLSAV
jgi:hypothetical protein